MLMPRLSGAGSPCSIMVSVKAAIRSFPLRLLRRLLSRVFRQDVQDRLHHRPYCLRASQGRFLLINPSVQRLELMGLQTHAYECSLDR
jgi:hypothetical protein